MNSTLDGQKISAILLMVGGLVMIMSLLMAWFSYIGWTRTGFDLLSNMINDQGYAYAPHLVLIVGIAAIVAGMLSLKFAGRAIPAIMIVLGIASIVLSAMFSVYCVEAQEYYKLPFVTVSAEAGVWVSIVGGIAVVMASLVMLVLSRPSAKEEPMFVCSVCGRAFYGRQTRCPECGAETPFAKSSSESTERP